MFWFLLPKKYKVPIRTPKEMIVFERREDPHSGVTKHYRWATPEIVQWFKENIPYKVVPEVTDYRNWTPFDNIEDHYCVRFRRESDALLYKLRWTNGPQQKAYMR